MALQLKYIVPTRPYSTDELEYLYTSMLTQADLSNKYVQHPDCGHIYLMRKHSRKHKLPDASKRSENVIIASEGCSVCWRLKNTLPTERAVAEELVSAVTENLSTRPAMVSSHRMLYIQAIYYHWLYSLMIKDQEYLGLKKK